MWFRLTTQWHRLKALVLDSVSSPITKRVCNLGLDEFFEWYGQEPRPGFTKATVSAWRAASEARGLGSVSINVRITAIRKLAVAGFDHTRLVSQNAPVADVIGQLVLIWAASDADEWKDRIVNIPEP